MFKYKLKSEINEVDGVYQFKINFPSFEGLQFVSMYLIKVDESYVLIDAGLTFSDCTDLFFSGLENLNISIDDLKYLIITHEHPDHIGIAKALKEKHPNIQILMHEITRDLMKYMTDTKNKEQIQETAKAASKGMMRYGMTEEQGKRVFQFLTSFRNFTQYHEPDRVLQDNDEIIVNQNITHNSYKNF